MGALILAIALVCACGAAANWSPAPRANLGWAAVALLILYFLLGAAGPLIATRW
jgi:hypothetical protein